MISEHELLEEIEKQQSGPVTYTSIAKLADLYTVRDHLYERPMPNHSGRTADKIEISGDSEFLKVAQSADANLVWGVLDELMSVLKVSNPRLYDGVMQKLRG